MRGAPLFTALRPEALSWPSDSADFARLAGVCAALFGRVEEEEKHAASGIGLGGTAVVLTHVDVEPHPDENAESAAGLQHLLHCHHASVRPGESGRLHASFFGGARGPGNGRPAAASLHDSTCTAPVFTAPAPPHGSQEDFGDPPYRLPSAPL
jgi:hypothetical protein